MSSEREDVSVRPGESVGTDHMDLGRAAANVSFAAAAAHDLSGPPSAQIPRHFDSSDRALNNAVNVTLDDIELPTSVHYDSKTYRLRLSGKGAIKVNQMDICVAMAANSILTLEEWDDHVTFYRLADLPFERFIHLTPEIDISLRHNSTFSFQPATQEDPSIEVECTIEDMSVNETTVFLQYVPVTYQTSNVKEILAKAGLKVLSIKRDLKEADRWIITVKNEKKEIPHYIHLSKLSLRQDEKRSTILVTMPGRLTECSVPGCRSTSHRANKCPTLNKDKVQRPPGQQHPRQTYASATKGWKNRARALELLEKESVEPKNSDHEWKTIERRRQAQNIRQSERAIRAENRFSILGIEESEIDECPEDESETPGVPIHESTPKQTSETQRLQRKAKSVASLVNSVLLGTYKKQRKTTKNVKGAGQADGGKTGQCQTAKPKDKNRRKRRKFHQSNSSGEPHQGASEDEWESVVDMSECQVPPEDVPIPEPEAVPELQPDPMSDAGRGQGPVYGGADPGTCPGVSDALHEKSNIQNTVIVHHDSSHSNSL